VEGGLGEEESNSARSKSLIRETIGLRRGWFRKSWRGDLKKEVAQNARDNHRERRMKRNTRRGRLVTYESRRAVSICHAMIDRGFGAVSVREHRLMPI
jgi:hypothetical protein